MKLAAIIFALLYSTRSQSALFDAPFWLRLRQSQKKCSTAWKAPAPTRFARGATTLLFRLPRLAQKCAVKNAHILTALSIASMTGAAYFETVPEKTLLNGDKILEFRLPNGLKLLLVPRHQAKVLSYQTWFAVGSVDEKLDPKLKKTGLAHLFEHMMFRGSERYPDGKFNEITSRIGVEEQNASTAYIRTNYYQNIPSHQLETLMELEADRMQHLKLSPDSFEKEKGAVVGELRRHLDSPASVAREELMRVLFEVAPFRFTILGSEEEIKGFSLLEGQYFYKTFYAPNNATLIVVGDVTKERLLPLVIKHYGLMASQTIPSRQKIEEPTQKKERIFERTHSQAASETLLIGYRIPNINSPDIVALSLLSAHLSMGMEGRLRKLLVDKGIAVSAAAYPSSEPDLFKFYVQMAENQRGEKALKIIDREIASLTRGPIKKQELERAWNQELLSLYGDISDNAALAGWLGEYLMMSGNYMRGFEILEAYKATTPKDLYKVAKRFFKKQNRSIVIVRPENKPQSEHDHRPKEKTS